MKRSAFTMLELVFVIVVLGIIAALAMPRLDRDLKQEAADNILSAIRYTQNLALMDNKHHSSLPTWQKSFWHITFNQCSDGKYFYRINHLNPLNGTSSQDRSAVDGATGKYMYVADGGDCSDNTVSPNILIGKKYGVTVNNGTGGCTGKHIGFDHLGRPHTGFSGSTIPNYSSYMSQDCTMNFTLSDGDTFSITVERETGYAYITGDHNAS